MKVIGIIAEYNPFHNGHQYQIEQAKKLTGADAAVIVMSGNFVQRGTPAIVDKYTRTRMALSCGADLVIELPLYYACGSAEYFAKGAISLLDKLGVIDTLVFGSECGNITLLTKIASVLALPTDSYQASIKSYVKQGVSFPKARVQALMDYFRKSATPECSVDTIAHIEEVLSSPNNILGIEYIKALITSKSTITPMTIQRIGAGYHDEDLAKSLSSATAIRAAFRHQPLSDISIDDAGNMLSQDISISSTQPSSSLGTVRTQVPEIVLTLLTQSDQKNFPVFSDDLSNLLHYKLLSDSIKGYDSYVDISSDLSDRIKNKLPAYENFEQFCDLLKSKDMTYTRISRCMLHILLNITKEHLHKYLDMDITPYARMLGFRRSTSELLSSIKKNSTIPLLSKLADAETVLVERENNLYAIEMLREEINASHIYNALVYEKFHTQIKNEYEQPIVIL